MPKARGVATDHPWHLRLHKADQFDFLLFGFGAEDVQAVFDQRIEVKLHVIQFDLPGFELGDVEDFINQRQQFIARAVDGLHVVALFGRERRAEQQFGHAQYAIHRCADFMADFGQKLGLGLEFSGAGRQGAAGAELALHDAALALTQCHAEHKTADRADRNQAIDQPF